MLSEERYFTELPLPQLSFATEAKPVDTLTLSMIEYKCWICFYDMEVKNPDVNCRIKSKHMQLNQLTVHEALTATENVDMQNALQSSDDSPTPLNLELVA
jgi:hypothetical protein